MTARVALLGFEVALLAVDQVRVCLLLPTPNLLLVSDEEEGLRSCPPGGLSSPVSVSSEAGRGYLVSDTTVVFRSVWPAMVPSRCVAEKRGEFHSESTSRLSRDEAGDFDGERPEIDMVLNEGVRSRRRRSGTSIMKEIKRGRKSASPVQLVVDTL